MWRKALERLKIVRGPFPHFAPYKIILRTCGHVPFGFSWESAVCPLAIGLCILPGKVRGASLGIDRQRGPKSFNLKGECGGGR